MTKRQTPQGPPRRTAPIPKAGRVSEGVTSSIKNNLTGEVLSEVSENTSSISELIVNPAHVSISLGATINMENFESGRVSVMVTRPCMDTPEDIERVYTECADRKINEEMQGFQKS